MELVKGVLKRQHVNINSCFSSALPVISGVCRKYSRTTLVSDIHQ